jgi:hypothetical protein
MGIDLVAAKVAGWALTTDVSAQLAGQFERWFVLVSVAIRPQKTTKGVQTPVLRCPDLCRRFPLGKPLRKPRNVDPCGEIAGLVVVPLKRRSAGSCAAPQAAVRAC